MLGQLGMVRMIVLVGGYSLDSFPAYLVFLDW